MNRDLVEPVVVEGTVAPQGEWVVRTLHVCAG